MRRCLAVAALTLVAASATAQPAPRPPGWPSDFCVAEGDASRYSLCGTCSTMMVTQLEGVGTSIQWSCKGADGVWMTHGVVRPWLMPMVRPTLADITAKGLFGALWDANTLAATPANDAKYAALIAKAQQYLPYVKRPAGPPPPTPATHVVAPTQGGLRPAYVIGAAGAPVRDGISFIASGTACTCDGAGNSFTLSVSRLCNVPSATGPNGAKRLAACVPK